MPANLIATTEGEFLLVDAALPGRAPEPIGVLLHERPGGRLELRMRRDWDQWMDEDEEEVFTALAADFSARIERLGADEFLRLGEDSFSHAIRFSERRPVMVDRFERTLDRLYRQHVPAPRPNRKRAWLAADRSSRVSWQRPQGEQSTLFTHDNRRENHE